MNITLPTGVENGFLSCCSLTCMALCGSKTMFKSVLQGKNVQHSYNIKKINKSKLR